LQTLLSSLPPSAIKPEVLEVARQKHAQALRMERQKTLEVIPEWQDESRREEELTGIVDHLNDYGFPKNYLETVYDHRTMRYIRDNYLREQRIRKALGQVKEVKTNPMARSRKNAQGAASKAQ